MNNINSGDICISKKGFCEIKKAVNLKDVDVSTIIVRNKIKRNNETSCLDDTTDIVTHLCIILPMMSSWIRYPENGGKNMSFKIKDDELYEKYNNIWKKIKVLLGGIKFKSEPIYDDQYIKISS